ncbi:MAG: amidoligase family protein [Proteobacteria bacterium]|nr:amidoligase family protein [Pseudomonadota bacterium]
MKESMIQKEAIEYLAVVKRASQFTKVLDKNGWVVPVTNEALAKSTRVSWRAGEEIHDLTGKVLNYKSYMRSGKPKHYIGILGMGARNTHVVLTDFRELFIPNDDFDQWVRVNDVVYEFMDRMNQPYTEDLEHLTFGIEFEFKGLKNARGQFVDAMESFLGNRFRDEGWAKGECWNLDSDSSIETKSREFGYELQSPILHIGNHKDYEELCAVLDMIKTILHGNVNASCGTHIHIGGLLKDFYQQYQDTSAASYIKKTMDNYFEDNGILKEFSLCYGRFEEMVFDRFVSSNRRANNNEYCHSCIEWEESRYRKINLECFDDNKTLENRQHHGTLDAADIWHWMELNGRSPPAGRVTVARISPSVAITGRLPGAGSGYFSLKSPQSSSCVGAGAR